MKRLFVPLLFIFCTLGLASAQSRKAEPESKLVERLYVGMNIGNISFGTNIQGQGTFNLNLAPFVGFNIVENPEPRGFFTAWSIGASLKFDYFYTKYYVSQSRLEKYSGVDLGPTLFTRILFLDKFFAQLEYENARFTRPLLENGQLLKEKFTQDYMYVGLGYSSGDQWKFDISLYYNLLDDYDSIRIPFDYRVSVSYHF